MFGIGSVVELRQLDRVNLDEFLKLNVQDELFVGVGLASEAGVTDQEVRPGKPGLLVAGVAGRLIDQVGEVDVFDEFAALSRCRGSGGRAGCEGGHGGVVDGCRSNYFAVVAVLEKCRMAPV